MWRLTVNKIHRKTLKKMAQDFKENQRRGMLSEVGENSNYIEIRFHFRSSIMAMASKFPHCGGRFKIGESTGEPVASSRRSSWVSSSLFLTRGLISALLRVYLRNALTSGTPYLILRVDKSLLRMLSFWPRDLSVAAISQGVVAELVSLHDHVIIILENSPKSTMGLN